MSTAAILGVGIPIAVVVVALLVRFAARSISVERVHEDLLQHAARATAASLENGATGRLAGVVTADTTLLAPLTRRPCVGYVARVEERIATGKGGRWVERIHEVRGVPFTIDDGTGRALIDPGQSTMLLEIDGTSRSGRFDDATAAEESFLRRHGLASTGWFLNKTLRYVEGVIEPGERVAVIGRGVREPEPDPIGHGGGLSTRVRIAGTADEPVLVTDRKQLIGA